MAHVMVFMMSASTHGTCHGVHDVSKYASSTAELLTRHPQRVLSMPDAKHVQRRYSNSKATLKYKSESLGLAGLSYKS